MRIGIICYPTYGGSGAVATMLGLALAEHGHDVHFISYAVPFRLRGYHERVAFHEVRIGQYPLFEHPPYSLALAVTVHEVAMKQKLDVIHAHYAIPHANAAWQAKQLLADESHDLAVITTLHGTDITLVGQDPSFYTITKFSIEHSDAVTAVSAYLRDETYRAFGCGSCGISVVPNFVNLHEFRPDPARRPQKEKVLMHISNMRPVKRLLDVVRIFALVNRQVPSRLVLAGDGPDRDAAEREADKLGVAEKVRFVGPIEDVADMLRWADLYLLPSASESFGLSALEALATGVPVVGTRAGGLPEVVRDGVDGVLAPVGDLDTMAQGAIRLLAHEDQWAAASRAARERAGEFAESRVIPQYEEVYAAVTGS